MPDKLVTRGLVLRATETKEADYILTVLTAEHGRLAVIARGARRRSSKLAAACQHLAFSELVLYRRGSWYYLDEASTIALFDGLRADLEKLSLASYFAEMAEAVTSEDLPSGEVLSLLLNSLYALIRCNPDQAREFTLTLSRVYRRVLERRKQILSTLAEEIDFTWQYYTLQKIRFDDRIELTTAIDPALRNWRIPSMSLQTLVENAVKHNSITGGNPLHIRIRTEGESFLIENNYTPRSDGDKESLGMGLERIRSVYRFYTEENISISVGDGTFRCRLPLLPPEK